MTLLRGETIMRDGEIVGAMGGGTFLPRKLSPFANGAQPT
jgi:hypothetical protein